MTSSTVSAAHAAHAAHNAEHYNKHASDLDSQPFIRPYLHWLHETFSLPPTQSLLFPSDPRPIKVLDYCCGTGNLTISLLPFLPAGSTVHGLDVAENSIKVYNTKFGPDGESKPANDITVSGYTADISSGDGRGTGAVAVPEEEGGEFWGYDLVTIGMGLHHLPSPELGVENLVKRLKKGGKFFIVDSITGGSWECVRREAKAAKEGGHHGHHHGHHGHHGHGHGHGHGHHHGGEDGQEGEKKEVLVSDTISAHGFTEEQIRDMFAKGGLEDIKFIRTGKGLLFRTKEDGKWEGFFRDIPPVTEGEAGEGSADEAEKPTEAFFGTGIKA